MLVYRKRVPLRCERVRSPDRAVSRGQYLDAVDCITDIPVCARLLSGWEVPVAEKVLKLLRGRVF
jgi:hypothetical protein